MAQFTINWLGPALKSLRICGGAAIGQIRSIGSQQQPPPQQQDKPKKPLTPYFRFMAKLRPEIKRESPNLKPIEISKLVGQRWSLLDEETKSKYANEFKSELVNYHTLIEKYNQSLTSEERESIQQLKIDRQLRREKREHRKRVRELNKPKKLPTPFLMYLMGKMRPGFGLEEYRKVAKLEGLKWKTLGEGEKKEYVDKYKIESEKYKRELLKWEGEMVKQGHDDLIRVKQLGQSTHTTPPRKSAASKS